MHGDFCFSNILFDFRKNTVKTIDPRGMSFEGQLTVYGDIRYDLAKFLHSALGKYDFIVSDMFDIYDDGNAIELFVPEQEGLDLSRMVLKKIAEMGFDVEEILAITCTLFLSMLPLHYDKPERQKAFVVTAIRIYKELNI